MEADTIHGQKPRAPAQASPGSFSLPQGLAPGGHQGRAELSARGAEWVRIHASLLLQHNLADPVTGALLPAVSGLLVSLLEPRETATA